MFPVQQVAMLTASLSVGKSFLFYMYYLFVKCISICSQDLKRKRMKFKRTRTFFLSRQIKTVGRLVGYDLLVKDG